VWLAWSGYREQHEGDGGFSPVSARSETGSAAYEGSALLANTFRDPSVLSRVARRLNHWIDEL
jgi:hypothetical protein